MNIYLTSHSSMKEYITLKMLMKYLEILITFTENCSTFNKYGEVHFLFKETKYFCCAYVLVLEIFK